MKERKELKDQQKKQNGDVYEMESEASCSPEFSGGCVFQDGGSGSEN